ncbi:MAG: protein kinase [Pirellulales bacterium]
MSVELFRCMETILCAAVEISDVDERAAYLDRACDDDAVLRQEVERMVDNHFRAGLFLERPDGAPMAVVDPPVFERPGTLIGRYKLLEQIGEGGMGTVYMAEQIAPVRRKVALKIIKPGMDSRQIIGRFEAERQALAMMDHSNIARVLDGGETDSGRPYFVMELVRGMPITDYCDRKKLSLSRRLECFLDVCRAIQHAHLKGIIHRDLKPTNVMVTECDGKSVIKVIDFGIAKAIGQEQLTERTLFTGLTQLIGTPAYMSPEQAALSAVDVDTRSDVYSLGVLLYEILTGAPLFESDHLRDAGYDGMRRIIQELDPLRPSARISTLKADALTSLSENRQVEPELMRRQMKRDLDWIVMKALEKDRGRRFQSATALIEDIEAFLRNDPVTARPPTRRHLLAKFARRHKLVLAATCAVIVTLVGGISVSLWQANRAFRAQRTADSSLIKEKQARAAVVTREASLRRELYAGDMADAWQAWNDGEIDRAKAVLDRYRPTPGQSDLREFSRHFLSRHCSYTPTALGTHDAPILTASLAPDGRLLASGDRDGNVTVWDIKMRRKVASWNYSDKEVTTTAFSPDGSILATAGQDATIRLWNVNDWTEMACLRGHESTVCAVSWSSNGDRLASGARDNSIRIWNVASQREETRSPDNGDVVRSVVWFPDNMRVAAAVGKAVLTWRVENWTSEGELAVHEKGVLSLAVSPDGRYLASSGYGGDVLVSDLDAGEVMMRATAMSAVWALSFSPDGRFLLGGTETGGPSIWQVRAAENRLEPIRTGMERSETQRAALLDPTSTTLVTVSEGDRQIRLWDASEIFGYSFVSFPEDCLAVAYEKDWAICAASDGTVILRQLSGGQALAELRGHKAPAAEAALSSTRGSLATLADDGHVLLWDLDSFQLRHRLSLGRSAEGDSVRLAFSPDESRLGAGSYVAGIRIWSVAQGDLVRDLHTDAAGGTPLAFAPNNRMFATTVRGGGGTVWNAETGAKMGSFGPGLRMWDICFAPNNSQLYAAAGIDGAIGWEIPSGREIFRLSRHRGPLSHVAVSPDGQTLATLAYDNSVRLWHIPTGRALFTLLQHTGRLDWLQFTSPTQLLVGARLTDGAPTGVFVFDAGIPVAF